MKYFEENTMHIHGGMGRYLGRHFKQESKLPTHRGAVITHAAPEAPALGWQLVCTG